MRVSWQDFVPAGAILALISFIYIQFAQWSTAASLQGNTDGKKSLLDQVQQFIQSIPDTVDNGGRRAVVEMKTQHLEYIWKRFLGFSDDILAESLLNVADTEEVFDIHGQNSAATLQSSLSTNIESMFSRAVSFMLKQLDSSETDSLGLNAQERVLRDVCLTEQGRKATQLENFKKVVDDCLISGASECESPVEDKLKVWYAHYINAQERAEEDKLRAAVEARQPQENILRQEADEQRLESDKLARKIPLPLLTREQRENGPRPNHIAILTGSDELDPSTPKGELLQLALQNRDEYTRVHGYQHIFCNFTKYKTAQDVEHPVWYKIPAILETFAKYPEIEWIWWLDSDAVIMDSSIDLVQHILHPDILRERILYNRLIADISDQYYYGGRVAPRGEIDINNIKFIITHDFLTLNAGSFFVKRGMDTDMILQMWGEPRYIVNDKKSTLFRRREQDAFIRMYLNHKMIAERTAVVAQALFNSYYVATQGQNYQDGDFLIHFAGSSNDGNYAEVFKSYYEKRARPFPDPAQ